MICHIEMPFKEGLTVNYISISLSIMCLYSCFRVVLLCIVLLAWIACACAIAATGCPFMYLYIELCILHWYHYCFELSFYAELCWLMYPAFELLMFLIVS